MTEPTARTGGTRPGASGDPGVVSDGGWRRERGDAGAAGAALKWRGLAPGGERARAILAGCCGSTEGCGVHGPGAAIPLRTRRGQLTRARLLRDARELVPNAAEAVEHGAQLLLVHLKRLCAHAW